MPDNQGKKILLLTFGYPPENGGSYNFFYQSLKLLPHQFTVLTSRYPGDYEADSASAHAIKRSLLFTLPTLKDGRGQILYPHANKLAKLFTRIYEKSRIFRVLIYALIIMRSLSEIAFGHYDLLWCGHSCLPIGLVGPLAKKFLSIDYTTFVYGEETTEIQYRGHPSALTLLKYVVEKASQVVVISEATRSKLLKLGVNPGNMHLAYPGVDIDHFRPLNGRNRFRMKFAPNGEKLILSVGRLIERKGFDMVIKSLPQIIKQHGPVKYIIAGSGPERKLLEIKVKQNKLTGSVIFIEGLSYDELPELYNACDIFVTPNRVGKIAGDTEGFGIVFLEASACGKPVIAGRSGGAVEAVLDEETGYVVSPDSNSELESMIVKILSDSELARRLGDNGRNRCCRRFTWQQTSQTLNEVISNSSGVRP